MRQTENDLQRGVQYLWQRVHKPLNDRRDRFYSGGNQLRQRLGDPGNERGDHLDPTVHQPRQRVNQRRRDGCKSFRDRACHIRRCFGYTFDYRIQHGYNDTQQFRQHTADCGQQLREYGGNRLHNRRQRVADRLQYAFNNLADYIKDSWDLRGDTVCHGSNALCQTCRQFLSNLSTVRGCLYNFREVLDYIRRAAVVFCKRADRKSTEIVLCGLCTAFHTLHGVRYTKQRFECVFRQNSARVFRFLHEVTERVCAERNERIEVLRRFAKQRHSDAVPLCFVLYLAECVDHIPVYFLAVSHIAVCVCNGNTELFIGGDVVL